ncbi:MAG: hypothetical protein HZA14_09140 [Nitrospirae bacterium]|nr:hypothetical protein [Nitrospirota bacterium]
MTALLKHLLEFFLSLRTTLWFLGGLLFLLLAGAFVMPGQEEFQYLHSMPLFEWLQKQPFRITWWLWGVIAVLSILTVNTLFCSIESIFKKRKVTQWLLLISPQIIHIGFLFMLLAHLLSALGGSQEFAAAREGSLIKIDGDDQLLRVGSINTRFDYINQIKPPPLVVVRVIWFDLWIHYHR